MGGLLSLWKALQDQQVDLTQDSFKLLLLYWVSECEILCVPYKTVFLSYSSLSAPVPKPCWPSKPDILGAHFPGAGTTGWGA